MIRKLLREFFLLRPGEQRALVVVSAILLASLGIRLWVHYANPVASWREGELDEFRAEAMRMRRELAMLDSAYNSAAPLLDDSRDTKVKKTSVEQPSVEQPSVEQSYSRQARQITVELNSADSAGLLPLPGIGPVYAGRIVRYRELLGGYVRVEQLLEVYGMDSARYLPLKPHLKLEVKSLRSLNLNTCSFKEFLRHPYLEYEDVLKLVRYRDAMGRIESVDEIRQNGLLGDSTLVRLMPYFVIKE